MLSAIASDSDNIVNPESKKKLFLCEVRAPNKIHYTEQYFLFFDCDTVEADKNLFATSCRPMEQMCHQLEYLKQQNLMRKTKQLMEVRTICLIGYDIYFIQVVTSTETNLCRTKRQDITYVRAALRWRPFPAAAVPAQMTGTQACTLQLSSLSPKAHPIACWTTAKERRHRDQPQLQTGSISHPVLWLISRQRLTVYTSQILRQSDGHHGETLSVNTDYQLCPVQSSHDASARKKVFFINRRKPRLIWDNVFFPLFYKWQWSSFFEFLQKAVDKSCLWSAAVVERTKLLATETEACIIDMATKPPSPMFCYDAKIQPKTNMEPSWNNTKVFLGSDVQFFPEPLRAHGNSADECMRLLTDFKKKMQQTELHARHLVHLIVTVNSLLLNITTTKNMGMKMH